MYLRRPVLLSSIAFFAVLSACSSSKSAPHFVEVRRQPQMISSSLSAGDAMATAMAREAAALRWATETSERNNRRLFEYLRSRAEVVVRTPTPTTTAAVSVAPTSPWDCIATAETGGDYTMHGSTYSTAFGMVNDIIYDYGTEEEQQAVFSGTATKAQQIAIASRFAAEHGFGGWGVLTKQKCGLG